MPHPSCRTTAPAGLDAQLNERRAAGTAVEEQIQAYEYGRFGWASDPEGNRFELWEPVAGAE